MKKIVGIITIALFLSISVQSQESKKTQHYPLIGEKAPKFVAESTQGKITFPNDFGKNWKILFSHPADFTPVCTSEILELCSAEEDITKMNVQFAVLSTDKLERHKNWVESMEGITYKGKSNLKVGFPLIADPDLAVSKKYGMIHNEASTTKNVRGVFIIDPENTIRAILYYPMEVGRNISEIERTVLALQKYDHQNVLTPANWQSGDDVIVPFLKYSPDYDAEKAALNDPGIYSVSWYLHLKKDVPLAVN